MDQDQKSKTSKTKSNVSKKSSQLSPKPSPPRITQTTTKGGDPVKESLNEEELQRALEELALLELNKPKPQKEKKVRPDIPVREDVERPPDPVFPRPPYIIPETKKQTEAKEERRRKAARDRNFCKWNDMRMPRPYDVATIGNVVETPSPEVSITGIRAFPRKPSITPSTGMPETPDPSQLALRKPKSGVFINITQPVVQEYKDSFDLVYERKPRPKRPGEEEEKKKKKKKVEDEVIELELKSTAVEEPLSESAVAAAWLEREAKAMGDGNGEDDETIATKLIRRKVSQISKATSVHSKDLDEFPVGSDEDLANQPYMTKIIQKFRRDSEAERHKPSNRKVLRGTLESHSFTKLWQPTLKEFYFGITMGTVNQGDEHFEPISRNVQGMCMSCAAYCYSMLVHPNKWTDLIVDDIVEIGNNLFMDSIGHLHKHQEKKELEFFELYKYCYIENKKVRFQVYEPEIVGYVRSGDRRVYNLYKGLKLFYKRHRAGILRSEGLNLVIWKDEHYYIFDAKGRRKDLVPDKKGQACLAFMYDIPDICTVLLEYSDMKNVPFTISKISVLKVMDKDAPEEDMQQDAHERHNYNIYDDTKAVIQGSFDMGDLCFDFSRNKQANAMAAVCLVYSRITPPSAWYTKTVDKIMIIGNQLYLELVESENLLEMALENLPAVFTIGPYVVEILIYTNVYADVMFRKGACMLQKCFEKFFENNSMAIVCIGKSTIAVWKQRNMYYCFDPYSRNNQALKCRNGNACVSMNTKLETVTQTIGTNFDDKDAIFYINGLKVLKIHRDPAQEKLFPKTMTMDDIATDTLKCYKMKKSKKKAVDKRVTGDFSEPATKALMPWDFLGGSLIEVGSGVESLTPEQLPPMVHKHTSRAMIRSMLPEIEKAIDLDSPSLSDTQIDPERPAPTQNDDFDMCGWELTQEELELEAVGEGEGQGEGEDGLESYMAMSRYAQVHAGSLDSYHKKMSAQVNTDITVGFLPVPRDILPATNMRWKQKILKDRELAKKRQILVAEGILTEPEITQSKELKKPHNFIDLPDNTQLIRGTTNIASLGSDIDYMAPFICMMASAVAKKYDVTSWTPEIIDFTLRSGAQLYQFSKVRYDQVPILDVPKVTLGKNNYSILVEYLVDTVMKQSILEDVLTKVLFKKFNCGLVVTPSYACAVFLKNHVYYLFDSFGCNEVGLGEGPKNTGVACFARFKNVHALATRIMYNKAKRETAEEYEFTRFVLSSCKSTLIPPTPAKIKRGRKDKGGEDGYEDQEGPAQEERPEPVNRVGYQLNDGILALHGSTALTGRPDNNYAQLKEDHFVCICAGLMLLDYPILRWDTRRVDYVIEQGKRIYEQADNLDVAKKRIIRNILIYRNFFDIIVLSLPMPELIRNRSLEAGLERMMRKREFLMIQFPNCCYLIYKHNDFYHLFDPYPCTPTGEADDGEEGFAAWTMFQNVHEVKKRIRSQMSKDGRQYIFYIFQVTSIRKAPKKLVLSQRLQEYEMDRPIKPELVGKPFHEKDTWLLRDPVPWSRIKTTSAKNDARGTKDNMWHNWDIEYPKDLYSLVGTVHQTSEKFDVAIRGKQTLANLVVALGMLEIYDLSEWNSSILDSILVNGCEYFGECIKTIKDEDYELGVDDLIPDCSIFPYKFEVSLNPVVEGTMFLMRAQQYNLYKALKLFLDNYDSRYGIICVDKGDRVEKRFVAFGKVQENEYFMYDCQCNGAPMFVERQGVGYILRCKTFKRLLHVLVLTLRGGDFFIFEVEVDNFTPAES